MKAKLLSIAAVVLLLMLALVQISAVVQDRQNYRTIAIEGVARSLAGEQTLTGPLLHRSCTEEWDAPLPNKPNNIERREFQLALAPAVLDVQGNSQLEPLARGLHVTQAFNLKAKLSAQWPDLAGLNPVAAHAGSRMSCNQPIVMLSVSDARGIRHADLRLGEQALMLKPGTLLESKPRGVHAILPANLVLSAPLNVAMALELVGTERLAIVPIGGDTQVKLHSNWPHPSFGGQFLPVMRKVAQDGFEANWRVNALASTAQQDVSQRDPETLSVTFVDPGNTYALSDRATKYGLLFIGLTFLAVGLFEFMKSLRVHPIQYLLVGAAMSLFFLLLVSLSEHMAFGMAYAMAAAACVLLLTYYACHMLKSWKRGLPFGLGIAALYGMLFVLLQMEQTALVLGAIALFVILAVVMLMTRQVDWYARLESTGSARPTRKPDGASRAGGLSRDPAATTTVRSAAVSAKFCD